MPFGHRFVLERRPDTEPHSWREPALVLTGMIVTLVLLAIVVVVTEIVAGPIEVPVSVVVEEAPVGIEIVPGREF